MIGQTISHYRILSKLGEGGMGVVYLAEDTHLERHVAIKFSAGASDNSRYRARFLREARLASALSHRHIARVYDFGEAPDGQLFIVMELVSGEDLSRLLRRSPMALTRSLEIIECVAEALSEAHRAGIVHRDIKPSNLVLDERGEVKVLDFGLAKQVSAGCSPADSNAPTWSEALTRDGAVVGTPSYMSPEQAKGAEVDARSDLFSLGVMLYECLAGRPPFVGANAIEIGTQVIHVDPPPPSRLNPDVPPELDRLTLKALAKRPEARYQSADEVLTALRTVRAQVSEAPSRRTRRFTLSPGAWSAGALNTLSGTLRRPRLTTALLLAALLAGGWASWRFWARGEHKPSREATRWYEEGVKALRDDTYYKASKALGRAIALDDRFALAQARLAEAWIELDYTDKATYEIARARALIPDLSRLSPLDALYLQAINDTAVRNFRGAVESYREVARQAPDAEKPSAYVALGRAYEKNEEIEKAIESYAEAAKRDPQYAAAFLRLGILYGRKQALGEATARFDRAEGLYQDLSNYEGVTEVLYQQGLLLSNLGKLAEARARLQSALSKAQATTNEYQQIKVLLQLSTLTYREGDAAKAQGEATEAINLARANGIENLTMRGLIDLGNAILVRGEVKEAEKNFVEALELARKFKARRYEARALFSLANLRIRQGSTDEGLRCAEQALAFYQQGGYRKEAAQALSLIGRAKRDKGDYQVALQALGQQLQLAEQVGDPSQVALSHDVIASVLFRQERYPEALDHFEKSYAIYQSLGNQLGAGYSLLNRGNQLWQLGRYPEAQTMFAQAIALADKPGGPKDLLVTSYRFSAEMALSQRRFPEAKAKGQQALTLAGTQFTDTVAQAKRVLGLAHTLSGAAGQGRLLCEEAVAIATRLGDPWLLSKSQLSLSEVMLEGDDAPGALNTALRAQESFARSGQQDSEWRAWLTAARASRQAGDHIKAREYASQSARLLSNLEQKWGKELFKTYLARPDLQHFNKQLGQALAASN